MPGFIDGMGGLQGCGSGQIGEGDGQPAHAAPGVAAAACSCTLCQPIRTDQCEACKKWLTAHTVLSAGPGFAFPTADIAPGKADQAVHMWFCLSLLLLVQQRAEAVFNASSFLLMHPSVLFQFI